MKTLLLLLSACVLGAAGAQAQGLEGVYTGTMTLADSQGQPRQVPLSLSMVLTGETVIAPNGEERQVIDAAYVVDEEGGPYAFSKVTFDIDENRLDFRYNRPQLNLAPDLPSSFRLVGGFDQNFAITGRVLSGTRGLIGTFSVQQTRAIALTTRSKYVGIWAGQAELTGGGSVPYRVVIQDSLRTSTNPPEYEFEYTNGKVAYMKWNSTKISVNQVAIDYLRRRVVLFKTGNNGEPALTVECVLDLDTGKLSGHVNSVFRGRTASFNLAPVVFNPGS